MNTTPLYKSPAFISMLTVLVVGVLGLLKISISTELQGEISLWVGSAVTAIGGAIAIVQHIRNPPAATPTPTPTPTSITTTAVIAMLCLGMLTGGCSVLSHLGNPQTPADKLNADKLLLASVEFAVAKVIDDGKTSPELRDAITKARDAARDALAIYETKINAGATEDDADSAAFDAAVNVLLQINSDAGGQPVSASPSPVVPVP